MLAVPEFVCGEVDHEEMLRQLQDDCLTAIAVDAEADKASAHCTHAWGVAVHLLIPDALRRQRRPSLRDRVVKG